VYETGVCKADVFSNSGAYKVDDSLFLFFICFPGRIYGNFHSILKLHTKRFTRARRIIIPDSLHPQNCSIKLALLLPGFSLMYSLTLFQPRAIAVMVWFNRSSAHHGSTCSTSSSNASLHFRTVNSTVSQSCMMFSLSC